jgi:Ca2+-transporting ATPase
VVTITLALGVTRMAKRHALIRKLPAVETLGSATVICTDKTGTLTKNEMTVTKLLVGDGAFEVTGEGYEPVGEIRSNSAERRALSPELSGNERQRPSDSSTLSTQDSTIPPGVRELLTAAVLCNGATLRQENGAWQVIGDPTEGALLVAAAKVGLTKVELERAAPFEEEYPFDPERKMMTVIRRTADGSLACVKGAPDVLLARCTHRMTSDGLVESLSDQQRNTILGTNCRRRWSQSVGRCGGARSGVSGVVCHERSVAA